MKKEITCLFNKCVAEGFIQPFSSIVFVIILASIYALPSYAANSGYYEIPEAGRPPSAFSSCCCKIVDENSLQTHYACKIVEDTRCPEETKQYPAQAFECPSTLIVSN